jgi:hypothetical protein
VIVQAVTGSGAERGLQHGAALSVPIQQAADALSRHLRRAGHDPGRIGSHLLTSALVDAARRHTPDLWDEVEATARGAGIPLREILLLTFLDEVWGLTRRRSGCSVLARRTADGTSEIGQTMDLPDWAVGRVVVLRLQSVGSPAALVMTYPGMIGLCGAAHSGVAVAVNALSQFGLSESGLGAAFIVRHLLTLTSAGEVDAFIRRIPHAVGQAYTVAVDGHVMTYESGPDRVELVSATDAHACAHTNHPLATEAKPRRSSLARLAAVQRSLAADDSLEVALSGDVVVDGHRYRDPNTTFAAFAFRSDETFARFADGADLRHGRSPWLPISFR